MLGQVLNLSPRRLLTLALLLTGVALAALLIILWQVGIFDSAPPPAALESAVESLRQDDQQQPSASPQASEQTQQQSGFDQDEPQQQTTEPSAASDPGSSQDQSGATDSAAPQSQQDQQAAQAAPSEQATVDQYQDQYQDDYEAQAQQNAEPQQQVQQAQPQQDQQDSSGQPSGLADLAGSWTISERGESFVGYRIGEELANIGTTTAVGRTGDIEAVLVFDGAAITSVVITADLRTLRSDQSFRDSALRSRGIETDTYPFATFMLTEPIAISELPVAGQTLSVTVGGTLELHGVTNAVAIDLQGQYVDGLVVVAGSTEIALADYDIEKPTGFRVLSIEDIGIMEFELVFERTE